MRSIPSHTVTISVVHFQSHTMLKFNSIFFYLSGNRRFSNEILSQMTGKHFDRLKTMWCLIAHANFPKFRRKVWILIYGYRLFPLSMWIFPNAVAWQITLNYDQKLFTSAKFSLNKYLFAMRKVLHFFMWVWKSECECAVLWLNSFLSLVNNKLIIFQKIRKKNARDLFKVCNMRRKVNIEI